jgi:hypothetical protein
MVESNIIHRIWVIQYVSVFSNSVVQVDIYQLVNEIISYYGTRRFIIVYTKSYHYILP